mmetsp:Transcript_57240/g.159319  ORF Transcript_57240/g.159319 Transcript_57240/m.159319 type:complete len:218 (-) Transcript_57240:540-1193(-)
MQQDASRPVSGSCVGTASRPEKPPWQDASFGSDGGGDGRCYLSTSLRTKASVKQDASSHADGDSHDGGCDHSAWNSSKASAQQDGASSSGRGHCGGEGHSSSSRAKPTMQQDPSFHHDGGGEHCAFHAKAQAQQIGSSHPDCGDRSGASPCATASVQQDSRSDGSDGASHAEPMPRQGACPSGRHSSAYFRAGKGPSPQRAPADAIWGTRRLGHVRD